MELMHSEQGQYVRCVTINTSLNANTHYWHTEQSPESEVLEMFAEAIGSLYGFENLKELQLNFAMDCAGSSNWTDKEVAETPQFRSEILEMVFAALQEVTTLKVLSIKNLQDQMDRRILESETFHSVRSRLSGLHLQITTEREEQHDLHFESLHRGFTTDLPELWLKPVLSHLTHLTLYSYTSMWGLFPFVDFRQVGTFPCLESLSLGNFTIAHDWQFDWILSHGSTLKQLLLDDCFIITALKMEEDMASVAFPGLQVLPESIGTNGHGEYFKNVSLRWHDIFDRFRSELPHLQDFAMHTSDLDWSDDAFDYRYDLSNRLGDNKYHVFDCGTVPPWQDPGDYSEGYNFYLRGAHPNCEYLQVEFPQCHDEDAEALRRLLKVVNQRAKNAV